MEPLNCGNCTEPKLARYKVYSLQNNQLDVNSKLLNLPLCDNCFTIFSRDLRTVQEYECYDLKLETVVYRIKYRPEVISKTSQLGQQE